MTLEITPVRDDQIETFKKLTVAESQKTFVGSNEKTFRQMKDEPGARVFGLWHQGTPVGLMAIIDMRQSTDLAPEDDPNSAFLWRLMVAKDVQARGFGRAALNYLRVFAKKNGLPRLETSVVPENEVALGLYERFGFTRTGRMHNGELVLERPTD